MKNPGVDFSKVVPATAMAGADDNDTALLASMLQEARTYLSRHNWCGRILDEYFGLGVGGIVAVFLFKIHPSKPSADPLVWVIVGDIPPLYISIDGAPNPACALDAYLGAITHWAKAAIEGGAMDEMPPINAVPTKENGQRLMSRIDFIDREVLKMHAADLEG